MVVVTLIDNLSYKKMLRSLVFAAVLSTADAVEYTDTALTTELWQLISKNDESKTDEALEAFLFQNPDIAMARSADKRGGLWWAWEYKNSFALGALKAYGADPNSAEEDDDGSNPKSMCVGDECTTLDASIADTEKVVLERKKEKEAKEEKELDEEDDDDLDDDDSTVRIHKGDAKKKKQDDASLNVDVDEDEDEEL